MIMELIWNLTPIPFHGKTSLGEKDFALRFIEKKNERRKM